MKWINLPFSLNFLLVWQHRRKKKLEIKLTKVNLKEIKYENKKPTYLSIYKIINQKGYENKK